MHIQPRCEYPNGIQLRVADASQDASLVARLAQICWRVHYTNIIGRPQVDYMLETIQSEVAINRDILSGRHYRIIEDAAAVPIGYLAYDLHPDHVFLSKLYILPDLQRCGAGSWAIRSIRKLHPSLPIRLTVNKHNHKAINFYLKSGFADTGSVVADIGSGFVMDDRKMGICALNNA